MSDKHMDEVITEFKAKFKYGDEHCKFSGADLLSHIPKACRSYARKWLEDIRDNYTVVFPASGLKLKFISQNGIDKIIDRLDKEPT